MTSRRTGTPGLYRRCGCRNEQGRQYGTLPDNPTEAQRAKACPAMLTDSKHGRWSFRLSAGFDPVTKKRRQVNGKSYATKREAQRERNKAAVKLDAGTYVRPSRETLAEYLPKWLARRAATGSGLRPSTLDNYGRYIANDISPSPLGRMHLSDIRRHHVNTFIDELTQAGRGAVTVRRIVAVLQGALSAALTEERIEANPAHRVALPRVTPETFRPWEPSEVGTFLDAAVTHRLGAVFEMAVLTGLRRAELVALRWEDVDLEGGRLVVRESKTDAGRRSVPLPDAAVGSLIAWQIAQDAERATWGAAYVDTGRVFTLEDGSPLKPQYVTRLFDRLRLQAARPVPTTLGSDHPSAWIRLPKSTMHSLRHQFAALQIAAGTPLSVVSKVMGHSSVAITSDIYSHLVHDTTRDALNAGASLIPRGPRASSDDVWEGGAHTLHTHRPESEERAVSNFSETASDLRLSQSG